MKNAQKQSEPSEEESATEAIARVLAYGQATEPAAEGEAATGETAPVEEPVAYQVTFPLEPIVISDTVPLSGPNFNLNIKDQINNSTISLDYTTLTSTSLTSSRNQLHSLLEEKGIDINIDFTNFNDFIHFSSVEARLENFYYKMSLLEDYSSSIAILDSTTNNNPSSSLAVYEAKISDIITNFDEYDYYLYYSSGSWAWPKTTSQPPYQLATTGSAAVLNWFGSSIETSPYYGGIALSASNFDNLNQNNLYYSIPEYLRNDPANEPYQIFVEMVGQLYDNIWIYYKDVSQKYNADNRLESGISKDIVADAIRDFGIKLYQNNFSNEDLFTAFLGITPEGGLFPFPNITGSLPTPSGFEYVNLFEYDIIITPNLQPIISKFMFEGQKMIGYIPFPCSNYHFQMIFYDYYQL